MPPKSPGKRKSAAKAKGPKNKKPAGPAQGSPPDLDGTSPILERQDIHRILSELSRTVAPADLENLMVNEKAMRERAIELQGELPLLARQLDLALDCLRDHLEGDCPQIPYHTISLLTAAVTYFSDEIDLVPDFLPHGSIDDAMVMAMACNIAAEGLHRYCTATGRSTKGIFRDEDPEAS